uniref:Uncharacterized protein n=1 Tax=Anguilla anguilla TaxID=7936 RepID=A0A0E9P830_ANGAN
MQPNEYSHDAPSVLQRNPQRKAYTCEQTSLLVSHILCAFINVAESPQALRVSSEVHRSWTNTLTNARSQYASQRGAVHTTGSPSS